MMETRLGYLPLSGVQGTGIAKEALRRSLEATEEFSLEAVFTWTEALTPVS